MDSNEVAECEPVDRGARQDFRVFAQSPTSLRSSKGTVLQIFGFRADSWQILAEALRERGRTHNIVRAHETGFGMRYIVEGELNTPLGRRPRVRTVWQFDEGTIAPRLITAYPLEDS
jgi:uncharacterized protein DUF6883